MSILGRLRDGSLLGAAGRDIAYLSSSAMASQIVLMVGQVLIARLYSPDEFGYFAVILAWANILAVLATLRYEMAIPMAATDGEARALTRLCLMSATLAAVGVVMILGGAATSGEHVLEVGGAWWAVPFLLWGTAVFTALRMLAGRGGDFARIGRGGVVASIGQVGVQVGLGAVGWPAGLAAGHGVGRVVNAAWLGPRGGLGSDASVREVAVRWKRMPLLNSFPALLNVVSVGAVAPLVERWFGVALAGQFGFATRLLAAPAVLLGQAVSQVLFPKLARLDRAQGAPTTELRRVTEGLALVSLPVFSVVWLLGPELFALVFGEPWRDAGVLAAVMAPWLAANFISSPLSSYATVRDRLGQILFIALAEAGARLTGLYMGVVAGSAMLGVALYSAAGVTICLVFTSWVLSLAGVSRAGLMRDLRVPIAVAALAAGASVAARLLHAPTLTVVVVGTLGILAVSGLCGGRLLRLLPGRSR